MVRLYGLLALAWMLPALVGCLGDAPRTNPLDPLSDDFENVGAVEGRVTSRYAPFVGLEGARVVLVPLDGGLERATRTGADGGFTVDALPVGRYAVVATFDGYETVTDTLEVNLGDRAVRDLRLNGVPRATSFQVRTLHISRWFPIDDLYRLDLDVQATDADGLSDIVTVRLVFPTLAFADTLAPTLLPGRFTTRLPAEQLPGGNLPGLLGQPYHLEVIDRAGAVGATAAQTLVRVIDAVPVTLSPQELATVEDATPVLTWQPLSLPFPFTYRVEIVRVETNVETVARTLTGLPQTATSVEVPLPLPSGTYYWTVAVVDAFGNLSRSKEAGFRVP